jgi:type I restriction enzyme, R subunit
MKETKIAVVISEEQGEVEKFRKWGLDIWPHRKLLKEGFLRGQGNVLHVPMVHRRETLNCAPCAVDHAASSL